MQIVRITRTYHFESAHFLPKVPTEHKCHHMHGHNYRVDLSYEGFLDERGFVKDFFELDTEVAPLLKMIDHKVLNNVQGLENPTAEVIALWFLSHLNGCASVRVYENNESWAEVSDPG